MATTNLLQWNPTAANQETDAEYAADSQRSGGATDPSLFDATLANKMFYQLSTYLTALFTAFANKGFGTSDASLLALVSQCANFLTTADVKGGLQYLLYAPTQALNAAQFGGFQMALNGNLSFTISGYAVGDLITLVFTQGSGGGAVVTPPSNVTGMGSVFPTAGSNSIQIFKVLNDNNLHAVGPMTVS